ncbi:Glycine betaine transport system permease protein OpuAB [subsurface metagenome]|uniref:ABC transporter permease subunit n=1 Tax=Aerophobetes bacterium TaxID=2030807 RepID=A0A523TKW2_UNCAE|nr:MAG: ABC transporter permease subunit [Candidatus Aerophobetes bacterium]
MGIPPPTPLGELFAKLIYWLVVNASGFFDFISDTLDAMVSGIYDILIYPPAYVLIAIFAIVAWLLAGKKAAFFVAIGLLLCNFMGKWTIMGGWETLWPFAMKTLALVIVAVIVALVIAIPLGVLSGVNKRAWSIFRPLTDFMQTLPMWVYMIPAVMLFGLGFVPALVATLIFAIPPPLRLTNLGIRGVPKELVEVGQAFGATGRQTLIKIQLPSALPSIMVGINQCVMMALSMVVLAGLIGAGGLGGAIVWGMTRVYIDSAFEGGLAVVLIAIMLDRFFEGFMNRLKRRLRIK